MDTSAQLMATQQVRIEHTGVTFRVPKGSLNEGADDGVAVGIMMERVGVVLVLTAKDADGGGDNGKGDGEGNGGGGADGDKHDSH